MPSSFSKWAIAGIIIFAAIGTGVFLFFDKSNSDIPVPKSSLPVVTENSDPKLEIIGRSAEGRNIESFTYGNGKTLIAFVGGIHGGYEWNSVLLAYKFMEYIVANPGIIPKNLTISVIPSANPDGVYKVTGKIGNFAINDVSKDKQTLSDGRFNSNKVDLNRNFDCKWKPQSTWQSKTVNAGSSAFSEPESKAVRDFVLKNKPSAVIFWHSQANAVYASECKNGVLPETLNIMNEYSSASGYPPINSFDGYEISGDAEGWLASINIPAITVELKTHETIEWEQNLAGIKAVFEYYKNKN